MTKEAMQKLFGELVLITETFFNETGKVENIAFVVTPAGRFAQRMPWKDDEEKAFMIAGLKADMKTMGAERFGLVGEAWMVTDPQAMKLAQSGLVPPSGSSRRKEVVFIQVEDPSAGRMFGYREIISTKRRGKVVRTLGQLQNFPGAEEGGEVKGSMTNLLED